MEEIAKDCDHIDCEWKKEDGEWADDIYDDSIHWGCPTNGCFSEDRPLIQHAAPIGNIDDRIEEHFAEVGGDKIVTGILWMEPGKSWSLTYEG
jgi:hypothetical protein